MNRVRRWCDVTVQRKSIVQWISLGWNRRGEMLSTYISADCELRMHSFLFYFFQFSFTFSDSSNSCDRTQLRSNNKWHCTSSHNFRLLLLESTKNSLALHSRCTITENRVYHIFPLSSSFEIWTGKLRHSRKKGAKTSIMIRIIFLTITPIHDLNSFEWVFILTELSQRRKVKKSCWNRNLAREKRETFFSLFTFYASLSL